jgi:hypothetical protein
MSANRSPGVPPSIPPNATPSKAQLADYLVAQADELEKLAAGSEGDLRLVEELAVRFAEVARANQLEFIAERFDRFRRSDATGTHGG